MFKSVDNFYEFIRAKLMNTATQPKLNDWENASENGSFTSYFIYYNQSRKYGGYKKSIGEILEGRRKQSGEISETG